MLRILDKKYLELLMGFAERLSWFDKSRNLRSVLPLGIATRAAPISNDASDLCVSDKISLLRSTPPWDLSTSTMKWAHEDM